MANYDAQINLIISGGRQLRELEDRLNGIQSTIEEINDLGANAVMGRSVDMRSYARVLQNLESIRSATTAQVGQQERVNAATRQQLLLYSQLNREQNLYRRRSSAFTEESRGVRETNLRVIELTTQLRTAQRAFSQLFAEADVQGVRTINTEIGSLLEELREINRVATGTKNVGANTAQLQAQADGWQQQINALRQRAAILTENEEILARLFTAERNLIRLRNTDMTFRDDANVRLGKQELTNAENLIKQEERLNVQRQRDAKNYELQLQRQTQQIQQQAKEFRAMVSSVGKIASKVGSATLDAVTFGQGAKVARGTQNAAVRAGLGLGALGLGKAAFATTGAIAAMAQQTASQASGFRGLGMLDPTAALSATNQAIIKTLGSIGAAVNDALGGVPGVVADMLSAIGQIPDSLGLAAVAAFAFAPAIKSVSTGLYNLGKAAGDTKIGSAVNQFLTNINPLATAAYGSIEALTNGLDQLRGKTLDLQQIAIESKNITDQLNDSYKQLPLALPAAGQTSFKGAVEYSPSIGAFAGGGARSVKNAEFLIDATGKLAARSQMAADSSQLFAEGLGQAASEAKTIADYLSEAVKLQTVGESSTQKFIRDTRERGRAILQNQRSEQIARERSARLVGGQYSLSQIPARGELFPGGRTETRQPDYRAMLNQAAQANQAVTQSLDVLRQRAIESLNLPKSVITVMTEQQKIAAANEQIERRTLGNVSEGVAARRNSLGVMQQERITRAQINAEDERSVEIIRARNRELRATPVAAMSPAERIPNYPSLEGATLDPASLRAQRLERVRMGRAGQAARGRALSEGLVGGAFPLLFGQGLGSSIGGGAGGALGGLAGGGLGFGLSLIGTALGSIFDQLNKAAQDTGNALRYPSESFDKLREAGLFASRQQEYYISKLIESGKIVQANAEIQKEIIKKVGVSGINDLTALGESSSRLSKSWAEFNLQLQAALAGPMAGLLDWVNNIITDANKAGRETAALTDFMKQLTPKQQEQYIEQSINLMDANNGVVDPQKLKVLQQQFLPNGRQATAAALSPEQKDAVARAQSETKQLQAQVELAGKRLSITGLTLEKDGARYVQLSKSIALQEYDNKLLEIRDSWIGKVFDKEKNIAMIRSANLEYAAKLKQIEAEIAENARARVSSQYQAEIQYQQEIEKRIDILAREEEIRGGQQAGIEKQISLSKALYSTRQQILAGEEALALAEARKNGTEQQVREIFTIRFGNLEREANMNEKILQQKRAELILDKQSAIEQAKQQAAQPFIEFRSTQELDTQYAKTYYRLLKEGIVPTEAQRIANFERMVAEQRNSLDLQIKITTATLANAEALGISVGKINDLKLALEGLKAARSETDKQALAGPGPKAEKTPGLKIQEFISQATAELNDLEAVAIRVSQSIGDAVGNSLANGISGLIEGTTTAKQIFADFLKSVGQILVQEGTKMIGMYIAIAIAKAIAGLGSSVSSATAIPSTGNPAAPTINGLDTGAFANIAANGAYFSGGMSYFANGGMFSNKVVSSPTLFKFADGGAMKAGVMGEAGPEAVMPLRRGANGRLGVDASGLRDAMGKAPGSSGGAGAVLNMSFETTKIGDTEYVSRDQLEAAMAATRRQASSDGAKRGMAMALDKLQQSPQARRRIGI